MQHWALTSVALLTCVGGPGSPGHTHGTAGRMKVCRVRVTRTPAHTQTHACTLTGAGTGGWDGASVKLSSSLLQATKTCMSQATRWANDDQSIVTSWQKTGSLSLCLGRVCPHSQSYQILQIGNGSNTMCYRVRACLCVCVCVCVCVCTIQRHITSTILSARDLFLLLFQFSACLFLCLPLSLVPWSAPLVQLQ